MNLDGYEITKYGTVISHRGKKPKILKPGRTDRGRFFVKINGKNEYVHRLVMYAHSKDVFHFSDGDMQVNHINEVYTDNCIDNLEWMTNRENTHYSLAGNQLKVQDILSDKEKTYLKKLMDYGESISKIIWMWKKYRDSSINEVRFKKIILSL